MFIIRVREEFNHTMTEVSGLLGMALAILIAVLTWFLGLSNIIPIRIMVSMVPLVVGSYYFWSYFGGIAYSIVTCSSDEYFINWIQTHSVDVSEEGKKELETELRLLHNEINVIQNDQGEE